MIKLLRIRPSDIRGFQFHVSGWPATVKELAKVHDRDGILLDDFVDQTFLYNSPSRPHTEPWVGIFHHPAPPVSCPGGSTVLDILKSKGFQDSVGGLLMAVTLSRHLAQFIRKMIPGLDVHSLKLPTRLDIPKWNQDRFFEDPKLLQVGWFMRNTKAIHEAPLGPYKRIRVLPSIAKDFDSRFYSETRIEADFAECVGVEEYLSLLSSSVVINQAIGASACNVIVECIASSTPIIINKHPAVVEYLGPDYPLYMDTPSQVPDLFSRCLEAHLYLRNLDKRDLDVSCFVKNIVQIWPSRGLGDSVHKWLYWVKSDCGGCKRRRSFLNSVVSYANKR